MADVKIVDIDGSQWDMKDQVTRDKIVELEKNFIAQDLQNVEIDINIDYTASQAMMDSHYKIGKIHFMNVVLRNISGPNLGTTSTAQIGKINIKAKKQTSFILNDYINKATLRCHIDSNGTIAIGESVGLVPGSNSCLGELIFAEE